MMDNGRRNFLRAAGLAASGLAAAGAPRALGMGLADTRPSGAAPGAKAMQARQWAMAIDLRKLTHEACRAIARACHAAHNVPDIPDERHRIFWIRADGFEAVFAGQDHANPPLWLDRAPIPALCNHCRKPVCVRVCPTQATFQRPDGIVMMDYHRCIGCRYCMAACPYGARGFNWEDPKKHLRTPDSGYPARTKGVVEKCNFCQERLARGQLPACVEACGNREILFGDLEDPDSEVSRILKQRFSICRKPGLGTQPRVYYLI